MHTTPPPVTHMQKFTREGQHTNQPACANKAAWNPLLTSEPLKVTCKKCIAILGKKK